MSNSKSARVGRDVVAAERPFSRPQPAVGPARAAGHPRVRGGGRGGPPARIRFATGLVLVLALALAGFGAEGLASASRSRSRVASLQAEVSSLQQRLVADERGAASESGHVRAIAARTTGANRSLGRSLARLDWSLQSVPSEGELARLRSELSAYVACAGQLQGELDGLGIDWRIDPAKPSTDYFKLVTSAPASRACAALTGSR